MSAAEHPAGTGRVQDPMGGLTPRSAFMPGMKVCVYTSFDGSWSKGFEVAESNDDSCRIRRLSDGEILPVNFDVERLVPAI